jgi:hypothetical protein
MLWIIGLVLVALFLNNVRRTKNGKEAPENPKLFPNGKASDFDPHDITKNHY